MKGFTLWEPWATLMALGFKKNETRSWRTHYRGPLVIHAAKTDRSAGAIVQIFKDAGKSDEELGDLCSAIGQWPFGKVVAVVRLVDCISTEEAIQRGLTQGERAYGDYSPGRFAWITSGLRKVDPPVAWKGSQGLWNVPERLASQL